MGDNDNNNQPEIKWPLRIRSRVTERIPITRLTKAHVETAVDTGTRLSSKCQKRTSNLRQAFDKNWESFPMWAHITRTQMEELVEAVKEDIKQTEALQVELRNKRFEENWWYKRVAYDAFHFWKQHPPNAPPPETGPPALAIAPPETGPAQPEAKRFRPWE